MNTGQMHKHKLMTQPLPNQLFLITGGLSKQVSVDHLSSIHFQNSLNPLELEPTQLLLVKAGFILNRSSFCCRASQPIHAYLEAIQSSQLTYETCIWTVGGNCGTWRKATHARKEHANSSQKRPGQDSNQDLLTVCVRQGFTKQHSLFMSAAPLKGQNLQI